MPRIPVRDVTRMLLEINAKEFQLGLQTIRRAAIKDEEVPSIAELDLTTNPPTWVLPDPPQK